MTASRAVATALAVMSLVAATGGASAAGLRGELVDPISGSVVVLEPGATALHVVFFATWCPPCVEELEPLRELDVRWGGRGYRLVVVAVAPRQDRERLRSFARDHTVPGELLYDERGEFQRALSAAALPTHVVFDADGREVARAGGLEPSIRSAIESLVRGRERGRGARP